MHVHTHSAGPHGSTPCSCLLLLACNFACASSTVKFPAVNEGDLPFFLEKLSSPAASQLHVIGSVSFLAHRPHAASFALSRAAVQGLIPLTTLEPAGAGANWLQLDRARWQVQGTPPLTHARSCARSCSPDF
jgi:hypothetical protein